MTLRSKIWRVVVILFLFLNLLGTGYAAVHGEALHAAAHAGAVLLTVFLIWRFSARNVARY